MSKIANYAAVTHTDIATLNNAINAHLREGWQPLGSIAVTAVLDTTINSIPRKIYHTYTQALVKEKS